MLCVNGVCFVMSEAFETFEASEVNEVSEVLEMLERNGVSWVNTISGMM